MTEKPKHPIYEMSKEEVLEQLLKKECGYYQAVLDLSRQEHEALQSPSGMTTVSHIMRKKKILMQCIAEIDLALKPIREYWNTEADRKGPQAEAVQEQLSTLDELLKEIIDLDRMNQKIFQQKLLDLRERASQPASP